LLLFFRKEGLSFLGLAHLNILSIQSAVAYGHVGNAAAVFPLQRLGAEVWPVNTVQFSNHPGYGSFTGTATPPETIRALIDGIAARGVLPSCDALLTGYVGDPATATALLHAASLLRAANPRALWACDPVIGDDAPGIYVRPGIAEFFREQAVPQADILTPNQFELACLTNLPCRTLAEAKRAIEALHARMPPAGPRAILVTSFRGEETPAGELDLICATPATTHRIRVPHLPLAPNGAGDAIAALFLFHLLQTADAALAAARAASAIHGVLTRTLQANSRELLLIAAQDEFITPTRNFLAMPC
jgi:pyridoxine kinase